MNYNYIAVIWPSDASEEVRHIYLTVPQLQVSQIVIEVQWGIVSYLLWCMMPGPGPGAPPGWATRYTTATPTTMNNGNDVIM